MIYLFAGIVHLFNWNVHFSSFGGTPKKNGKGEVKCAFCGKWFKDKAALEGKE